jgi:hypothetical protein
LLEEIDDLSVGDADLGEVAFTGGSQNGQLGLQFFALARSGRSLGQSTRLGITQGLPRGGKLLKKMVPHRLSGRLDFWR